MCVLCLRSLSDWWEGLQAYIIDRDMQLHCLADAPVEDLYQVDVSVKAHVDEVFAFDRTVSRLLEVRC